MTDGRIGASLFMYNLDYQGRKTYVIGHQPADADSVCSALALAHLYQKLGIDAEARTASPLDRETRAILDYIGVQAPEVLKDAEGEQLVLVDHNSLAQAVRGARKARIVGVCDHHALSGLVTGEIIPVHIAPLGSTSTVIYLLYQLSGISIDPTDAALMSGAILSDTNNCRYPSSTPLDKEALQALTEIAGIDREEMNLKRLQSRVDYGGMTPRQILLSDYRPYSEGGYRIGIGYARSVGLRNHMETIELLREAAEEYFPESGCDLFFIMIHDYDTDRQDILCIGEKAREAVKRAFGGEDGRQLTLTRSISRKGDFLPAIVRVLGNSKENDQGGKTE